jgi:hypothetical protein
MFISGEVAIKEHDQIQQSVELLKYLSPGLYEMKIDDTDSSIVTFEERSVCDILEYDDGLEDEEDFEPASTVSAMNQLMYKEFISPFVKFGTTEQSAEFLRLSHPLRLPRYFFSDLNPLSIPLKSMVPLVKDFRLAIEKNNSFSKIEHALSNNISTVLDSVRETNDMYDVLRFKLFYGNPLIKSLFAIPPGKDYDPCKTQKSALRRYEDTLKVKKLSQQVNAGNPVDGLVRIMIAVAGSSHTFTKKQLETIADIMKTHGRFKREDDYNFKKRINTQSEILRSDRKAAIDGLGKIIISHEDRVLGIKIARQIASARTEPDQTAEKTINDINNALFKTN